MPAYLTCPTCGFNGAHGFTEPGVGGIVTFYHSSPTGTCRSFTVNDLWFTDKGEAWKEAKKHIRGADPTWLKAWDALLIGNNQKEHERLLAEWRKENDLETLA